MQYNLQHHSIAQPTSWTKTLGETRVDQLINGSVIFLVAATILPFYVLTGLVKTFSDIPLLARLLRPTRSDEILMDLAANVIDEIMGDFGKAS